MKRTMLAVGLAASLAVPCARAAADGPRSFTLREESKDRPGNAVTYHMSARRESRFTESVDAAAPGQVMQMARLEADLRTEVTGVTQGHAMAMRVHLLDARASYAAGQPLRALPSSGKWLKATGGSHAPRIARVDGRPFEDQENEAMLLIAERIGLWNGEQQHFLRIPRRPLKVGDTWTPDMKGQIIQDARIVPGSVKASVKVAGWRRIGGFGYGTVDVKGDADIDLNAAGLPKPLPMHITISGTETMRTGPEPLPFAVVQRFQLEPRASEGYPEGLPRLHILVTSSLTHFRQFHIGH